MILRGGREGVKSASVPGRVGRSVRDQSGEGLEEPGLSLPINKSLGSQEPKGVKGTPLSTVFLERRR